MKKNIKLLLGIALLVVGLIGLVVYRITSQSPTVIPKTNVILFYGRECPHCQEVEDFLQKNKVAEKIAFDSIEVWHNKDNAELLLSKARACSLADEDVGVPFLYANGKCLVGTQPVEDFFKMNTQ